jgi:hypothetical protein
MMLEVLSYRQREGQDNPPSKKVSLQGVLKIRASTTSIGSRVSNQT